MATCPTLFALARATRPAAVTVFREVAPRVLGMDHRREARRNLERARYEFVDAHELAHDDHAEALHQAERDAPAEAALLRHRVHVSGHLEEAGDHRGEPAPGLVHGGLRARETREKDESEGERRSGS